MESSIQKINHLNKIGIQLSAEKDMSVICEGILAGAMELTDADAGSLYVMNDNQQQLDFSIVKNTSLGIHMGGCHGSEMDFPSIELYREGKANRSMVVSSAVHDRQTIHVADVYAEQVYDFSGTREFDRQTGYKTHSILTVPMMNHEDEVIGVLQLINALETDGKTIRPFNDEDVQLAESLASQAAVAMTNRRLIDEQRELFEAFIRVIASAIDEKSPYTGGHCKRVPELCMMIAEACHKEEEGPLSDFRMNEADRYEMHIAGWLHDCGKVTTPEYVVDKATKLETIHDRISEIDARFEILKRDDRISQLEKMLADQGLDIPEPDTQEELEAEQDFLRKANIGGEFMQSEDQQKVREIGQRRFLAREGERTLLNEEEIENLIIPKGTLTDAEREVINHHIVATINMLEQLPFPRHLANVPEYVAGHHERMDGKGYPNGLTREQMSVQARMVAIADIFEALTAADRPYKEGKRLSECMRIMGFMKEENHIDPDIFNIFVKQKVYKQYAERFLPESQIDEVDHKAIPGMEEIH